jgi:hypothetical protein
MKGFMLTGLVGSERRSMSGRWQGEIEGGDGSGITTRSRGARRRLRLIQAQVYRAGPAPRRHHNRYNHVK